MVKLKYADGETPLRNEHKGYTFIPSNYGQSAFPGQKNDRKRYEYQWLRMQCNQKAVRNWRDMSTETKNAWETFAATYPQPTKADPNKYLTGYQLFVKRNFYKFLHEGINSDFILEPELSELPDPDFTAEITDNGMCLDVTEWFIKNFGILPNVGQFLICRIVPMAVDSGQFFAPLVATLEVQEVFIDGLFLSLSFTGHAPGVVFSVYLSKPVRAGVAYPGTKFRYMGCFKPTQFIQLTDTPDEYTGQAGKFVAVKETEDGLEFVEGGGGGITCDDLADCPSFEALQEQVNSISEIVSEEFDTSIPPISLGLLYNYAVCLNPSPIFRDGWRIPTYAEMTDLVTYLGGTAAAGGQMKETGLIYWASPNTGASNLQKFNMRGNGNRSNTPGNFSAKFTIGQFWTILPGATSLTRIAQFAYNNTNFGLYIGPIGAGRGIRICRDAPGIADGTIGSYVGFNNRTYRTVVINELEITADNLAETKFADGSTIPEVTDNSAWIALTTPGLCAYDNDWSNV